MAPSGAGAGSVPRYIDPDHVFELYINRRADDLLDYVSSIPGADGDTYCNAIKLMVKPIRVPGQQQMELSQLQIWADHARKVAQICRFSASKNVADLANITANSGHCSGMKTNHASGSHVLRHSPTLDQGSAMLNQGSASSLRIPPPTSSSTPLQAYSNDGHYMNPFDSSAYAGRMPSSTYVGRISSSPYAGRMPGSYMTSSEPSSYSGRMSPVSGTVVNGPLARPAMLNQPSASNSGIPAAAPFPCRASSNDVSNYHPRYAAMLNQTSASNTSFPASIFQQANSNNDSKGMKHAPCVILQEERFVRLSIASFVPYDGTEGFGGVLMQGSKGQFICALCFPLPGTEPASVFSAACCESIRAVQCLNPTAVVLESHLFPLLCSISQRAELSELEARLNQVPSRGCNLVSEESNDPACQLAMHASQLGRYHIFRQKPDWLVLR